MGRENGLTCNENSYNKEDDLGSREETGNLDRITKNYSTRSLSSGEFVPEDSLSWEDPLETPQGPVPSLSRNYSIATLSPTTKIGSLSSLESVSPSIG